MAFGVGTDDEPQRAMRVDVIGPILRVILEYEDGGLRPELGMADALDDPTQRQIVIGNTSTWRSLAQAHAIGMIARQSNHLQPRHVTFTLESLEFFQEAIRPFHVPVIQVEAAIHLVNMAAQGLHAREARVFRVFPLATNSP